MDGWIFDLIWFDVQYILAFLLQILWQCRHDLITHLYCTFPPWTPLFFSFVEYPLVSSLKLVTCPMFSVQHHGMGATTKIVFPCTFLGHVCEHKIEWGSTIYVGWPKLSADFIDFAESVNMAGEAVWFVCSACCREAGFLFLTWFFATAVAFFCLFWMRSAM